MNVTLRTLRRASLALAALFFPFAAALAGGLRLDIKAGGEWYLTPVLATPGAGSLHPLPRLVVRIIHDGRIRSHAVEFSRGDLADITVPPGAEVYFNFDPMASIPGQPAEARMVLWSGSRTGEDRSGSGTGRADSRPCEGEIVFKGTGTRIPGVQRGRFSVSSLDAAMDDPLLEADDAEPETEAFGMDITLGEDSRTRGYAAFARGDDPGLWIVEKRMVFGPCCCVIL